MALARAGEGQRSLSYFKVTWQQIFPLVWQFDCFACDVAYLALAEARTESLITGDLRLYNAVRDHLDWARWIGDGPHGR